MRDRILHCLRELRRPLSRFVMWQWSKMSLVSAKIHTWLIEKINGNNNDDLGPEG